MFGVPFCLAGVDIRNKKTSEEKGKTIPPPHPIKKKTDS